MNIIILYINYVKINYHLNKKIKQLKKRSMFYN